MAGKKHVYDLVAEDLAEWIDSTAEALADAIVGGGQAPFSAPVSRRDQLEYYNARFFNPDGSVNLEGRTRVIERIGRENFVRTLGEVMRYRRQGIAALAEGGG